ncbi:MAG: flagellar hook capping FlgD N-terminal domain-containing protein [Pseudomonadota bacterium]|jgi:Flagellar hook capping protein
MMITTATQATAAATAGTAKNAIGSNGEISQLFTTLLVAQIRNQDPLQPADPGEFISQLTQLSQVESLEALIRQNSANAAMLEGLQVLALGGRVGSQVAVRTERVILEDEPVQGRFTLANASADVSLVLESETGVQRRLALGARSAGDVAFTIDRQALGLPAGVYSVRVVTDNGEEPGVEVLGTLRSVRLSAEGVVVDVSHLGRIPSTAITGFDAPANASAG